MISKTKRYLICVLLILLLTSCTRAYRTVTSDIPLISHVSDLRVDAGVALDASAQATVSYALTDKVAIQGFCSIAENDAFYAQAATGYYKLMDNNKVMELYGGFGYGYGHGNNAPAGLGKITGNYQIYFTQLNYGKITSRDSNTEFGIGLKAGFLHSDLTDLGYYNDYYIDVPIKYKDDCVFIEPIGMIRFGMANRKVSLKLGGTLLYKFTNTDKDYPFTYFNLGLAVNLRSE